MTLTLTAIQLIVTVLLFYTSVINILRSTICVTEFSMNVIWRTALRNLHLQMLWFYHHLTLISTETSNVCLDFTLLFPVYRLQTQFCGRLTTMKYWFPRRNSPEILTLRLVHFQKYSLVLTLINAIIFLKDTSGKIFESEMSYWQQSFIFRSWVRI